MIIKTEIGSEFWDAPICDCKNDLFPISTQWYISGRSALNAIVSEIVHKGCRNIAMPSWCCESMFIPFVNAGIEVFFYPVYFKDGLVQKYNFMCDALFLMDYFGYSSTPPDLSGYKGIVIRDVTHSLFSKRYSDADYYFGSLRKWCGVWTGGFAWTDAEHSLDAAEIDNDRYITLRANAMRQKDIYINCHTKEDGSVDKKKDYLSLFKQAEEDLESVGIENASSRDVQLAQSLDTKKIVTSRKKNAEVLHKAFADWLIFPQLGENDCPMFVPILFPNERRDELRLFLIDHEIYCPTHWPLSKYHRQIDKRAMTLYKNELSLVCDQRYTEDDMYRLADMISYYGRGFYSAHSI